LNRRERLLLAVSSRPPRRRYLRAVGTTLAAGLAGCAAPARGPADDGATSSDGATPSDSVTPSDGATTTDGRPSDDAPATDATAPGTTTPTTIHPGYETTEVRVLTPDGDLLGAVTAAVADTPRLRYRGLGGTDSLPEDRGMLFVYDGVDDHTFVMREMDFGIDIVFADGERTITEIHHAPAPGPDEDGRDQTYPGRGQYVLEVNYGWTTDRGVEVGDRLAFDL
jgi:uncharacterized membrane protein (UPF0127 family)